MTRRQSKKKRGPPLSEDKLIDIEFKLLLDSINHRIASIKKKKNLTNPDEKNPKEKRRALYGLYDPVTKEVYISASKCKHPTRMSMLGQLIHELFHDILPNTFHHRIYAKVDILMVRFTDEHKKHLKQFIPKHC